MFLCVEKPGRNVTHNVYMYPVISPVVMRCQPCVPFDEPHWEEHIIVSGIFLMGMLHLSLLKEKKQWTNLHWRSPRLWICQGHECDGKSEEQLPLEERRWLSRMEKRDDFYSDHWDIWPNLKESVDWIIMLKQCWLHLEVRWKLYIMFFFWRNLKYFVWRGKCSKIFYIWNYF